jgi:flagellar assembly factor FliW
MSEGRIVVETTRFGRIEVEASEAFRFGGMPGFPQADRFVLMQHDTGSVFAWMISLDVPDLAFVVADPWQFFPDYRPPLEPRHLAGIGVEAPEDFELLCLASFQDGQTALNLAAPLLVNATERRGAQVILDGEAYGVREVIPAVDEGAAESGEASSA